jgi:hypothetical protein
MGFLFSEDKICITGAVDAILNPAPLENLLKKIVKKPTGGVELA